MRKIDAAEIADYMKPRQIHQVRQLIQAENIWPKIAVFGEFSDDFRENLTEYLDDFFDIAKKQNLIGLEFFPGEENDRFSQINDEKNFEFQGIVAEVPEKLTEKISRKKDIGGALEDSDFDAPETLAKKYLLAGFNLDENPENVENLTTLEIAALIDNLIRTCQENFVEN